MVSVLVVTYNSENFIRDCVNSLIVSQIELEIIIVDNNSKDASVSLVNELIDASPNYAIKLIRNKSNVGFAKAMNQAYLIATGEFVMTFNPDAKVFPDTLSKAVAFLESNPKVGKIGLADLDEHHNVYLPLNTFLEYNIPQIVKRFLSKRKNDVQFPKHAFEVDWLFGTGFLIRSAAIGNQNLYQESTFLFWEEYWLSKKIKSNGFKIYIVPDIFIHHYGATTFKFDKEKMFYARWLSLANEWIVRKDHFGYKNAVLNNAIYILDNALLYFFVCVKGLFSKKDIIRTYSLYDYRGKLLSAWKILWWPKNKLVEINDIGKKFFNS